MRKDAGLNGDLDRLPQPSWLLFLRAFSERVDGFRAIEDLDCEPSLDERYRWEVWGANEDFTGGSFLKFVNDDLLPYLRELKGAGEDDPRNVISAIFQDVNNRMLSGTLLRDLVNIVAAGRRHLRPTSKPVRSHPVRRSQPRFIWLTCTAWLG
jgi:type I restriction enzyme M protein